MYRALATANAFARAGWRVTVLTAPRSAFEDLTGVDESALAAIDPRVDVVRVPFDSSRAESDITRWSAVRAASPLAWNALRMARDLRFFPEANYGSWRPLIEAEAERIHERTPVTLTIGTANPYVDLAPGWSLWRRHRIPYVVDFRDTWHLDPYSGRTRGTRRSRAWERRLVRDAFETWFVNQPILDWHAERHPAAAARFRVVANGYDPDFLGSAHPPRGRRPLTLGYLGTVYGPMPLREVLEGWRLARELSDVVAGARFQLAGRLGHFSAPDPALLDLFEAYRDDAVRYVGPVPKSEVSNTYAGFDALALILGKSRYVTSGKVFEYVATGLPVVALHDPETASSTVLEGYPLAFAVPDLRIDSIAGTIVRAMERAQSVTAADIASAAHWARRYERDRQLEPRIAALREQLT
jgi:glycosyltransferase involved in cell wall biosynthesis